MLLIRYIFNSTITFINELVFIVLIGLISVVVYPLCLFLPIFIAGGLIVLSSYIEYSYFVFFLAAIVLIPALFASDFYDKYTVGLAEFIIEVLTYPFEKFHDVVNSKFSVTTEMELSVETTKSKFLKRIILFFTSLIHFTKGGFRMISKKTKAIIDEGKKTD